MDTANWPRELGMVKSNQPLLEEPQVMEMKKPAARPPHKEQALNCPRCNSANTKFCYYNNYSLTQPRYFCKTCRRYWTEGGSLRNVPVGGGSRKNKRSNPNPNPTTAPSVRKLAPPDLAYPPPQISLSSSSQNPKFLEGQDLNLSFPQFDAYPNHNHNPSPNPNHPSMELFKGMQAFMPGGVYSSGYGMQDFRPQASNFPIHGGGYEGLQENAGRMLFPFEDLKPVPSSSAADQFEQNRGQGGEQATGFWNTMIGGGGNW